MDDRSLRSAPPTDLYAVIDRGVPLEEVLTQGRILASARHDTGGKPGPNGMVPHRHWHRKILKTYDPAADTVLLSLEGSTRSLGNLDTPDREYRPEELYDQDWTIRPADHNIF